MRIRVPESIAPAVVTVLADYRAVKEVAKLHLQPVLIDPLSMLIPACATRIAAGFPSPADDYLDDGIDLNKMLVRNGPATYFYTIEKASDSMNVKGIMGGDRILVDRSIEARSGMIVLAVILGEGATVKQLEIRGSRIRLIPHSTNPIHKPRTILEGEELLIVGVVTSSITLF